MERPVGANENPEADRLHRDSGLRCLVIHHDEDGPSASCIRCDKCHKWFRPREWERAKYEDCKENEHVERA